MAMFLVVFRGRKRTDIDAATYAVDADRMEALARAQPGFVSFKSYAAPDGESVALSEWVDEAAGQAWRREVEHAAMQAKGRAEYYDEYTAFACPEPRVRRFARAS